MQYFYHVFLRKESQAYEITMLSTACLCVSPNNNFWTKRQIFNDIQQESYAIKGDLDAILLTP
jgi:hypothetical protein